MRLRLRPSSNAPGSRAELAAEIREVLRLHVQEAWFPICIDGEGGGYRSNYNRMWKPGRDDSRMLEFQARQARVAARFALEDPASGRWQEWALHGMRYLRDRMWDREFGGWYWRTKIDGTPLEGATKHSHGGAYAVETGALVFAATGERWALEHAEEGLDWHVRHAHDDEHGGFHNWMRRDGTVIMRGGEIPAGSGELDPLGHDVGLKDVNVLGDWFEAMLDLAAHSKELLAGQQLRELADIYLAKATTAAGEVHYAFHPDWMPQPGPEWYGYGFEATHRFLRAAPVLPEFPAFEERAGVIARHTLQRARHGSGGYMYAGPSGEPMALEGFDLRARSRIWWVQFEAVRVLAIYASKEGRAGPYWRRLLAQWRFVKENLIDERYGGTYQQSTSDLAPWRRPWFPRANWATRKGHDWKDASHETGALLMAIAALEAKAFAES
jgi:mannobiose 2-epimerase